MKLQTKTKKPSSNTAVRDIKQYAALEARIDDLAKRKEEVKKRLRQLVESSGYTDTSGHVWFDVPDEVADIARPHLQKRDPKQLDPIVTEEFLRKKKLWKRCSKRTITVELTAEAERVLRELGLYDEDEVQVIIDEDELYACRFEDKITKEELQELYASKVTYAFYFR